MIYFFLLLQFARANPYRYPYGYGSDEEYYTTTYYSTEETSTTTSYYSTSGTLIFGVEGFEICPDCKNGTCNENFECDCFGDWTGELYDEDPCSWTPCRNDGVCTVNNVTFDCACTEGYYGGQYF